MMFTEGPMFIAKGGKYGIALSVASSEGHKKVVRLLLEKGAHVGQS